LSQYQAEIETIRELLRKNPRGLTITDVAKATGTSRNSAAKYLDVMHSLGELEQRSIGPDRVFYLSQRIPLSAILDYSSDLIVVVNEKLDILQVNNSLLNLFNIEREEMVGKNLLTDSLFNHAYDKELHLVANLLRGDSKEEIIRVLGYVFRVKVLASTFNDGSYGYSLNLENITEEVKLRESLIALHRYSKALYGSSTRSELFDLTRAAMIEILGFDRADVWMVEDDHLVQVSVTGDLPKGFIIPLSGKGITVKVIKESKTINVEDITKDSSYLYAIDLNNDREYLSYEESKSELATPIIINGEAIGVLNVESTLLGPFSENDITLLELFSIHLSNALEKMDF